MSRARAPRVRRYRPIALLTPGAFTTEVVEALLGNKQYKALGHATNVLEEMRTLLKALNCDGVGAVVDAEMLKTAGSIVVQATETIVVTWSLYKALVLIPQIPNPNGRKSEAAIVLKDVDEKKVELGSSLRGRLELLKAGKLPPKAAPTSDE